MLRSILLIVCLLFGAGSLIAQNKRSLDDYHRAAVSYSPEANENLNMQRFNVLQTDLLRSQLQKPQVFVTSDYLFSPFFFNNGQFIAITPKPSSDAYGYDAALTNGGLYAAQLNVTYPLLNGRIYKVQASQNSIRNQVLQQENSQILHKLENDVTTQYINIYQVQQQIRYSQSLIERVAERKKIIGLLVEQGIMQQNDYLLLDIEVSSIQFNIAQQKVVESDAFSTLNSLCGISDTTNYDLSPPTITLSEPLSKFTYQQKYALDSMDIAFQQEISNTKYKPQLQVFGNTGLFGSDAQNIPHNVGLSAGLHLAIPLYDGHQKTITGQQNKLLLQSLGKYRSDKEIQHKNKFLSLLQQINNVKTSVTYIDQQIETQNKLLEIIKDKVALGQISVTDYLIAVRDFGAANQNKIQTQTQMWLLINQYNYLNW